MLYGAQLSGGVAAAATVVSACHSRPTCRLSRFPRAVAAFMGLGNAERHSTSSFREQ